MNICYIMFLEEGLDFRSENEISCVCLCGWGYYDIFFGRWYNNYYFIGNVFLNLMLKRKKLKFVWLVVVI